jgi:hypothetical protein
MNPVLHILAEMCLQFSFMLSFRLWHSFASGFLSSVLNVSLLCARKRKSMNKYKSKQMNIFNLKADFNMGLDLNVIWNHISKLGHLNKSLFRVKNRTLHEMRRLEEWSQQPLKMKRDTFIYSYEPMPTNQYLICSIETLQHEEGAKAWERERRVNKWRGSKVIHMS